MSLILATTTLDIPMMNFSMIIEGSEPYKTEQNGYNTSSSVTQTLDKILESFHMESLNRVKRVVSSS